MSHEEEECAACGGQLGYLGQLGTRLYFQCRQCGLEQSRAEDEPGEFVEERGYQYNPSDVERWHEQYRRLAEQYGAHYDYELAEWLRKEGLGPRGAAAETVREERGGAFDPERDRPPRARAHHFAINRQPHDYGPGDFVRTPDGDGIVAQVGWEGSTPLPAGAAGVAPDFVVVLFDDDSFDTFAVGKVKLLQAATREDWLDLLDRLNESRLRPRSPKSGVQWHVARRNPSGWARSTFEQGDVVTGIGHPRYIVGSVLPDGRLMLYYRTSSSIGLEAAEPEAVELIARATPASKRELEDFRSWSNRRFGMAV